MADDLPTSGPDDEKHEGETGHPPTTTKRSIQVTDLGSAANQFDLQVQGKPPLSHEGIQHAATIIGVLLGLLSFASDHVAVALIVFVITLLSVAIFYRKQVLAHRLARDILFICLGAAIVGSSWGASVLWPRLFPPPPPPPTPTPAPPPPTPPPPTPTPTPSPTPTSEAVYRTPHGEKYHRAGCYTIKGRDVTGISLAQAKQLGLSPCKVCQPPLLP